MQEPSTEAIHASLKRCHTNPRFLEIFYETFFSASPQVREKFAGTDMKHQVAMLEDSLHMGIMAADQIPFAIDSIKRLGEKHHKLGVEPDYYEMWLDSLMKAVAQCDEAFDADLDAAWRDVMRIVIDMMKSTYALQD